MEPTKKPDEDTLRAWHEDPSNWKMGIFYFNKKDRRIFPPKRMAGMGWTVNFANPYSILSLLAIIIALTAFIRFLGK